VIRAAGLGKTIDDRSILTGIDLAVPAGGFLTLLGPNGAGKTTLLHILATLHRHTTGALHLFGQAVGRGAQAAALRARIGLIGHQPMLYRDLTARENLRFFGRLYGVPRTDQRAGELLDQVELAHRADDPARTFSRGMMQRLAIARALMHEPALLLADEPFAGLDVPSMRQLEGLLGRLHARGMAVVLTCHDVALGLRLGQRVVVLRDGMVALEGTSDQLDVEAVTAEVCRR
jgi:heme exporter protein A